MLQHKPIPEEGSNTLKTTREPRTATPRGRRGALCRLFALISIAVASVLVSAQQSSISNIVGRVTDATGAVVGGATVHVVNQGTAAERTATSNNDGEFSIPNLPPATYELRVEKAGFKTTTIPSLELLVGKDANESYERGCQGKILPPFPPGDRCGDLHPARSQI
jgi:hypothetical protein